MYYYTEDDDRLFLAQIAARDELHHKDIVIAALQDKLKNAREEASKEFMDKLFALFPEDKNFTTISRMTVKRIAQKVVGDDE